LDNKEYEEQERILEQQQLELGEDHSKHDTEKTSLEVR
jgi:hypothetical protein